MAKKILSVGIDIASGDVTECAFDSNTSLLDWDIVLFRPDISSFLQYAEQFQGKTSLGESASFRLKERTEHWRREIKEAVQTGKTLVVFLPSLIELFVDTGKRTYSGTGRNQKTTTHVESYNNLKSIPMELGPVGTNGSAMKLVDKGAEILSPYWRDFESLSEYNIVLSATEIRPCLVTKTGNKTVGSIVRSKSSSGTLLLLPDLEFDSDEFYQDNHGEIEWTDEAARFAARLVGALVALDKALKSEGEHTPAPTWAQANEYSLQSEGVLRAQLLNLEQEMEQLQRRKEEILDALSEAGRLRGLLFEKGKPLENAIIDALKLIGFRAAPYKDSESEFDVVFESSEGRLIGEAEGKDAKQINVDKLRQLSMNIHEDLQRENVHQAAKGVLFGNAHRLSPVEERGPSFTDKCVSASLTSSTALVSTADLFRVALYLANGTDEDFARECRNAIITASGLVELPAAPSTVEPNASIIAGVVET